MERNSSSTEEVGVRPKRPITATATGKEMNSRNWVSLYVGARRYASAYPSYA